MCLRFSRILRLLVRHISIQTSFKNYTFVLTWIPHLIHYLWIFNKPSWKECDYSDRLRNYKLKIDLCHVAAILSQEILKKLCLCPASLVLSTRLAGYKQSFLNLLRQSGQQNFTELFMLAWKQNGMGPVE